MLLFKKKFIEQIKSGEKTQTIRLWKYRRMKPGQRSFIAGVGYVHIDGVERVELAELTDADAIPDGFTTADALRAELCDLYGVDILARRKLYIVRFSVFPPDEQIKILEEKNKKSTQDYLFDNLDV